MTSAAEPSRRNPHNSLRERPAYPNRNKPLFSKRTPQYDFFTDSLNESQIQSPSPTKGKEDKIAAGASSRQGYGGARTLNAAFKATTGIRDENRPPSSSSSSERKRTQFIPKPRPSQTNQSTPPRPAGAQRVKEPTGVGRGRSNTRVSAASSTPSPPRGLREAYNRIVDEENLAAHQHDSEDGDANRAQGNQRRQELGSPIALRATQHDMAVVQSVELDDNPIEVNGVDDFQSVHDLESEPTSSGLSFIENMTDDTFGKALTDHAKDEQRMKGVLKNNGQVFQKAHDGERAGLTLENLQRRDRFEDFKRQESLIRAGKGSVNSDWSDPPVHVPNTWGRKGRAGNEWLNRINEPGGKLTGDLRSPVSNISHSRGKSSKSPEGIKIDWLSAAADVPLPTVEDGSSLRGSWSRASTPTLSRKRNASMDQLRHWDIDNDFTARSIQVSTSPVLKARNNVLDQIRDREIASLKGRAVTTNRLGEIRERSSEQQLRRPSAASSDRAKDEQSNDQRAAAAKLEVSPVRHSSDQPIIDRGKSHEAEEGNPIPNTPIVIFKNPEKGGEKGQLDLDTRGNSEGTPKRPHHDRQDSRDLLRKLARAASASPSSTNDIDSNGVSQTGEQPEKAYKSLDPRQNTVEPTSRTGRAMAKPEIPKAVADEAEPEVHHSTSDSTKSSSKRKEAQILPAANTEVLLAASGIEVIHRSGTSNDINTDETPKAPPPTLPLKTPVITGAWVDTPVPTARQRPSSTLSDPDVKKRITALGIRDLIRGPSSSSPHKRGSGNEDRTLKDESPVRPKSGLAALVGTFKADNKAINDAGHIDDDHEAKTKKEDALGESTLDSLEDMIANDTDFSSLLDFNDKDLEDITPRGPAGQLLSTTERDRRLEMLAYERMNQRLKTLRLSIRDAKRGIEGLEHKVEDAPAECWPCPTCGCSSGGQRLRLRQSSSWQRYVPSLFTWPEGGRMRPTWLGWLVLAVGTWWISENTLCSIYCQPRYAWRMEGYGVDIYAPRMPWVTVTMAWRSVSWFLLPIWKVLSWLAWQVYGRDAELSRPKKIPPEIRTEWRNGVLYKIRDDIHDLKESHVQTDPYLKDSYTREDSYAYRDMRSRGDVYDEHVPVARDERIPRPSWGPDLSMMDDEYL